MTDSVTLGLSPSATTNLPFVVVVGDGPTRRTVPLEGTMVIGSSETADLQVHDGAVSRRHVRLVPAGGHVVVIDEGSKNGVFVGPTRVFEAAVRAPASLTIGGTTIGIDVARRAPVPRTMSVRTFGRFATSAVQVGAMLASLEKAAGTQATVLIEGESGTGKELLAEAIHEASPRSSGPFEVVDCAALAPTLVEAELFGAERGAFTGAERARAGAFVRARGGTLFLDEIGELPLPLQTRLLGALERRRVRPLGAAAEVPVDVRVVAATNRNLEREVEGGRFRLDLFHRLAVVAVRVPPLRERPEDILMLAEHFLRLLGGAPTVLDDDVRARLGARRFAGNVRELRNTIERLVVLGDDAQPLPGTAPADSDGLTAIATAGLPYATARELAVERFTADYVADMLRRHGGNVTKAAEASGIARRHFHRLKRGAP
jgi:two-component system nitrogen regulation response regulator GlnG